MQKRITLLSGITINIPNSLQISSEPFRVLMTSAQLIVDDKGQQIGDHVRQQQPMIASDLAPEVLIAINAQLQYLGFSLTPICAREVATDA